MPVTKSPSPPDCKSRVAAYVAYFSDPAYEAHPFDPFTDTTKPRRKRRRMSIARAITQVKKHGVEVTVDRGDGTRFTFRRGEPDGDNVSIAPIDSSEWN